MSVDIAQVEEFARAAQKESRETVCLPVYVALELVETVRFLALERDRLSGANRVGT